MGQAAVKICNLIVLIWLVCFPLRGKAQESDAAPDSLVQSVLVAADSVALRSMEMPPKAFAPNSTRAVLWAIIPGMGQVYNRKYWKLPFVYGGFMGFAYAVTWNGKNYQDYWGAYKSIMRDAEAYNQLVKDANGAEVSYEFSKEWTDFISTTDYVAAVNNVGYQNLFKSRKDFFRRNRDLSIILTVGFYLICMVDAYVDAELFNFDISPDLSLRIEPLASPQTRFSTGNIGLNCSITF
ncbi:MAG: DUF5683 domain-containing protein [Tannerellaceae bacterium]|jgi:hypothetical protein|nr:DUF5683 domain-containing protein [Tannerellaceae bacterium]